MTEVEELRSQLSGYLARVLADSPSTPELALNESSDLFFALELLTPAILRIQYPEWDNESIDGFRLAAARKPDAHSISLLGLCILITDQSVTPFQMFLTLADDGSLSGSSVRVGERGSGPLRISGPPCNSRAASALLDGLAARTSEIAWVYEASL